MELSSRLLRQCVAIADAGTASGAAQRLGLSPSALSRALARFEKQTELTVFRRHGSRLEPTEVGRDLLQAARQVVADLDLVASVAADAAHGRAGTIVIAMPPGETGAILPTMVAAVLHDRPRSNVHIEQVDNATKALDALRRGRCELALVPHLSTPPDLAGVHVGRHELALIVPPHWVTPAQSTTETHLLASLGEFPFVTGQPDTTTTRALARLQRAGARPRVVVTHAPLLSIPDLVAAGIGAALVPVCLASRRSADFRVVTLAPPLSFPVTLMYRPGDQSPTAQVFLEWARAFTDG